MIKKETVFAFIIFLFFAVIFFNKSFLQFQAPFPGDLLVGHYNPYSSYSFLGYTPGGFPHKAQNIDVVEQLYPWKHFSISSLKAGEFPFWNPYNFSGTPHLAAIQSGTFYPFNLIFLILPFLLAWSIYIISQPVLAGFFTYLFLRELKLGFNSSILGGLVFSFSSFLVVWMEYGNIVHALLWLPFVLWLCHKNILKPTLFKSIVIALALSLSVFAGHFQVSIYLYLFSFIYVLFNLLNFHRKDFIFKIAIFIGIYVLSLLFSMVQILPSVEIFLSSSRSNYSFERLIEFLIPQYHAITMFFPDFFGNPVTRNYWLDGTYIERVSYFGIVPLFFAVYALFSKKNPYIWFFLSTILTIFFITFDTFITKFLYSIYIPPIIATSVPTRIMYIFVFSASVLAAFGYEHFEKNNKAKTFIKTAILIGLIVLGSWMFVVLSPRFFSNLDWIGNLSISLRNLFIPTSALLLGLFIMTIFVLKDRRFLKKYSRHIKRYFFIFILFITIFELYFFFQKFTPFSSKETVYPQTPVLNFIKENQENYRVWGYGAATLPVNIQTLEKIYSPEGYDPFYIKRYGELLSTTKGGNIPDLVERANARLAPGYGEKDLRENVYRQKIMNLLGVKYVLHKRDQDPHAFDPTFDSKIYGLLWYGNGWQIYENKNVLPRAFLVTDYVVLNDKDEIIKKIYNPEFDLSKTIILEENPSEKIVEELNEKIVNINSYTGNRVVINTNADGDAFLFLSDTYFNGWKVYVDGNEEKIYRANYAFRAVFLPKGAHEVIYRYEPLSFKVGLWISLLSISGALLVIIVSVVRKRGKI